MDRLDIKLWPIILVFGVACAVGGWLIIEGIIWLFSHITVAWNGGN